MQKRLLFVVLVIICSIASSVLGQTCGDGDCETGETPLNCVQDCPILPDYITTHFTKTGGDGQAGGAREEGYYDPFNGKDADLRWMNYDKEGYPFDENIRPSYNDYHNELTAYNAVTRSQIDAFEQNIYDETGVHADILNYNPDIPLADQVLENHPNIQVINNIIHGTSLFTVSFPPHWTASQEYPVVLRGHGYGADNLYMYLHNTPGDAIEAGLSVQHGPGIIAVRSNCGGREAIGINSNAMDDVGSFLEDIMSNFGADLNRVVTQGASRAGNVALVWGANPEGFSYNAQAIHSYVPPLKVGSMLMLSHATYPAFNGVTNKVLGTDQAYRHDYEDSGGSVLTFEEKVLATVAILLDAGSVAEADSKSTYGYFGRADLTDSLKQKRILVTHGTHDPFMPMSYFLDFDYLLAEKDIPHTMLFGYCYGHGLYDKTRDSGSVLLKLAKGEEILPFDGNIRVFYIPSSLTNEGSGTERGPEQRITDALLSEINNRYEGYFSQDHDATKLAFSATLPYKTMQGIPMTVTMIGTQGKPWEIWCREEDGYYREYHKSGVFGETMNDPDEYEYGDEYVILQFDAHKPGVYEWFFTYDDKEIPNRFTPFMRPDGILEKATTEITLSQPRVTEYYNPHRQTYNENFGVDMYHPQLLSENNDPEIEQINDISVVAGETIELDIDAADSDGDELVYDLRFANSDGFVSGAVFNGLTGQFTRVTNESDTGIHRLKAIAKDGKGGIAEQVFTIEVIDECIHEADNNPCNGKISNMELFAYIELWKQGQVDIESMIEAIRIWKDDII